MTIDFRVFESKKYTFFIEDELVSICLDRKGEDMFYSFEIDKTTDTPRNKARRIVERKYLRHFLIALSVFIGLILLAALFLPSFSEQKDLTQSEQRLLREGKETIGKISLDRGSSSNVVHYQFIGGSSIINGTLDADQLIQLCPMPVLNGDEFVVVYVPSKPEINSVYINRPTEAQIEKFKERAVGKYLELHAGFDEALARCYVNSAYTLAGLDGIADFFFQNTHPSVNEKHNSVSFEKLIHELPFQKKVEHDCWTK